MKQTIVITGANGNLGRNMTKHLLGKGHRVKALVRKSSDSAFDPEPGLNLYELDVLDSEACADWVREVTENGSEGIDGLVCLVGGFASGALEASDKNTLLKMMELNFFSAYNLVKPMAARNRELGRPLQIVLVGSRAAIEPAEGKDLMAYSLSKSLLLRLAEYINEETNTTGIQAAVLLLSTLDTPANRASMPEENTTSWVPLDRVSETVDFIFSEAGGMLRNPLIYPLYNKA